MLTFSDRDIARFRANFVVKGDHECWEWAGEQGHAGHGRLWAGGRKTLASHIALALAGKPRQGNAAALHSCDNPPCVNPAHLRWGTQLENIEDRKSRGRNGAARGAANGSSRLTPEAVLCIRADTRSRREIADSYGVTSANIRAIQLNKTWSWVDDLAPKEGGQADMPAMQSHAEEEERPMSVG